MKINFLGQNEQMIHLHRTPQATYRVCGREYSGKMLYYIHPQVLSLNALLCPTSYRFARGEETIFVLHY
jgi:hypothetical protein